MRRVFVCLAAIFLLFVSAKAVFAVDRQIPPATDGQIQEAEAKLVPLRFLPSHPFYFLIAVKEQIDHIFQPSSAKRAQFDLILSGKRLKEAYMLLHKNDSQLAIKALDRYSLRLTKMSENLNKARSQNQEVKPIADEIGDALKSHEALLFAISRIVGASDDFKLNKSFDDALAGFGDAILLIDDIKPGMRDRFKTASESAELKEAESSTESNPLAPTPVPSYRPKRIIY